LQGLDQPRGKQNDTAIKVAASGERPPVNCISGISSTSLSYTPNNKGWDQGSPEGEPFEKIPLAKRGGNEPSN